MKPSVKDFRTPVALEFILEVMGDLRSLCRSKNADSTNIRIVNMAKIPITTIAICCSNPDWRNEKYEAYNPPTNSAATIIAITITSPAITIIRSNN